jgi:phosphoribosyl-ATP pyrophosphohydrolase
VPRLVINRWIGDSYAINTSYVGNYHFRDRLCHGGVSRDHPRAQFPGVQKTQSSLDQGDHRSRTSTGFRGNEESEKGERMIRHQMTVDDVQQQGMVINKLIQRRLIEKGYGIFVSRHEIMGSVNEEKFECTVADHDKDHDALYNELADLAVACIMGMVSIASEKMDY